MGRPGGGLFKESKLVARVVLRRDAHRAQLYFSVFSTGIKITGRAPELSHSEVSQDICYTPAWRAPDDTGGASRGFYDCVKTVPSK